MKNHLSSCNLSRTKVTEYDLILARAGRFNLSLEEVENMVVCPAQRHNLGIHWRPRKDISILAMKEKKIALYCKNPINWQMAHEIREMFVTLVQVGSRKYTFICSVVTPLAYSLLMKWSGINKCGKRVSIGDIYICFVLQFAQVVRGVACHAMFTEFSAKLLFQRL